MEIKQGDKVRVSKDAPWLYVGGLDRIFAISDSVVTAIEDDNAAIKCYHGQAARILIIPTKYLVKVEAEAKEPKFKAGDMVIDNENGRKGVVIKCYPNCYIVKLDDVEFPVSYTEEALNSYTEPTAPIIKAGDRVRNIESGLIGVVDKIVYGNIAWVNGVDGKRYHWKSDELKLVLPTEQTEAEKRPDVGSITIPVEVDLSDGYWDAYAADLAKEVVLKTVNSASDRRPSAIAEYATDIAKAVVEGLKRK